MREQVLVGGLLEHIRGGEGGGLGLELGADLMERGVEVGGLFRALVGRCLARPLRSFKGDSDRGQDELRPDAARLTG